MDDDDDLYARNAWAALVESATSDWTALDERFEQAIQELSTGMPRAAYNSAIWILERDAEFTPALRVAALASLTLDNRKQARSIANRLIEVDGADWRNHIVNSWVLLSENKGKKASSEAVFALHVAPTDAEAYASAAAVNSRIGGQARIAREAAERAIYFDPTNVQGRLVLAQLEGREHNWPEAVLLCEEAVALEPYNELALATLAKAQAKSGRRQDAVNTYERLGNFSPSSEFLQPEKFDDSAGGVYGYLHTAFFTVVAGSIGMAVVISARPIVPLIVLTLSVAAITVVAPIRQWLAIRLNPRAMGRASAGETWAKKNPDIVVGLVATGCFATLLLIAALSTAGT